MLVDSMDHKEIKNQLTDEYEKIQGTTVQRLVKEYARERVDLKIDKAKNYPRNYSIKTAGKNNWIIFLTKPPFVNKYRGINDTTVCAIAYTTIKKGYGFFIQKYRKLCWCIMTISLSGITKGLI